jgi:hypothetical protein
MGTKVLLTQSGLSASMELMLGRVSALKDPHQRLFVVTLLSQATASSNEEAAAFLLAPS